MSATTPSAGPRALATLLGLFMALPFLAAGAPSPQVSGVDPVRRSPFHDPVTNRARDAVAATAEVSAAPAVEASPEPAPTPSVLATVAGVELLSVSPDSAAHGFHEGSTRSLELTPVGRPVANKRGIELPPAADEGVDYVVMTSRGRATSPTSAVDVAVAEGTPIASPVTGQVIDVSRYALYGKLSDVMIRIRPAANPDVTVTLFHVTHPAVGPGDEVIAGETVVAAGPRPLPFGSQIDKWVGHAGPHVHIQVDRP
ncbi:MAG: M23 family metallopeptidase [Nitriliruptorales bacterium]|nr:M23 family metallopeptidase [Nitriliruptorales bacterium]